MKKYVNTLIIIAATLSSISCIAIDRENAVCSSNNQLIDFVNVKELTPDLLNHFLTGAWDNMAVEFSQGDELPLEITLDGDLFAVLKTEPSPSSIVFKKTVLVRNHSGKFFMSTDYQNWIPMKRFFSGSIVSAIEINEKGPTIAIRAKLNQRTPESKLTEN